MFTLQQPRYAWLSVCSSTSTSSREACFGQVLRENGSISAFLRPRPIGLPDPLSPVQESAGTFAGLLRGKNVGTPMTSGIAGSSTFISHLSERSVIQVTVLSGTASNHIQSATGTSGGTVACLIWPRM